MAKIRYGKQYSTGNEAKYVATDDGWQMGMVEFTHPRYEPNLAPSEDNRTLFNLIPGKVHTLAVNTKYRRQGVASQMLSQVERNHGEIGHRPPYHHEVMAPSPIFASDTKITVSHPIPGDSPPMTYSKDLSDDAYPLLNNLVSGRTGTDIPTQYLKNGAGRSVERRNEWAENQTRNAGGGKTQLEAEYPEISSGSPPPKEPINTRRSGGKIGPSRKRSLNIIPSATQLKLPLASPDALSAGENGFRYSGSNPLMKMLDNNADG